MDVCLAPDGPSGRIVRGTHAQCVLADKLSNNELETSIPKLETAMGLETGQLIACRSNLAPLSVSQILRFFSVGLPSGVQSDVSLRGALPLCLPFPSSDLPEIVATRARLSRSPLTAPHSLQLRDGRGQAVPVEADHVWVSGRARGCPVACGPPSMPSQGFRFETRMPDCVLGS